LFRKLTQAVSALACALVAAAPAAGAENRTVERDGYKLVFKDRSRSADQALADRMIDTFFAVYPRLAGDFNPAAPRKVKFVIDPRYHDVAYTKHNRVSFNPDWFKRQPRDIDAVTHELMHVVQHYGKCARAPIWLTEGIADYARSKYGVDNAGAGWSLPAIGPDNRYTDGYRVTAAFLFWMEGNGHPGLVKALDADLRACTYGEDDWQKLAGTDLETAWTAFPKPGTAPVVVTRVPLTAERLDTMKIQIARMEQDLNEGRADPAVTPQTVALAKTLLAQEEARLEKAPGDAAAPPVPTK